MKVQSTSIMCNNTTFKLVCNIQNQIGIDFLFILQKRGTTTNCNIYNYTIIIIL